jgi:hypothetical protein
MADNKFGILVSAIQHVLPHGQVEDGPINWDVLAPAPAPHEDILVPTYGFYGGPNYTGGVVLEPGEPASFTQEPLDVLDAASKAHDLAYESTSLPVRATADIALLDAILQIGDDQLTPEGHLYAAATTVVILGQLGQYPAGTLTTAQTLDLAAKTPAYIADATANLAQAGLQPAPDERGDLVTWLHDTIGAIGAVAPDLVGGIIAALQNQPAGSGSDVLDFRGLTDAAHDVPAIHDGTGAAHLPEVDLAPVAPWPPALADWPQLAHHHMSDWPFI